MRTHSRTGAVAVVLAAGKGTRVGAEGNKAYLPLAGRRMVSWTLESLSQVPELARTVLVIRPEERKRAEQTVDREAPDLDVEIIEGGNSRHESEYKALQYLAPDIESGAVDVVLIHDAARPLAGPGMMRSAISVAREFGGAVPALEAHDLVKVDADGNLDSLETERNLIRVQTPQAFRAAPLLRAYGEAVKAEFEGTDTSSSVERFSDLEVRSFQGDERNLKVTYAHDLFLAERLLADNHFRLT
ncbi:MAG: 2-C-methyl-D-erythritol 4-phosphate cytidylyltransferase [Comamonadaceae bacterium]|nr:MAG: 2-C-methyl-D-erythritol 4-phosphate cytidylyltransferase [Comamonadaceae bacterium]